MDQKLKIELSQQGIVTTTLEELYNWGRKNSLWPMTFGLACCAIEMIATTMARYDLARFGAEFPPGTAYETVSVAAADVPRVRVLATGTTVLVVNTQDRSISVKIDGQQVELGAYEVKWLER